MKPTIKPDSYWDSWHHLHPDKGIISENGILFAAYYWWLTKDAEPFQVFWATDYYETYPYNLSRDNYIGYIALCRLCSYRVHPIPKWYKRLHPWDLAFYAKLSRNPIIRIFYIILYPIYAANLILSCTRAKNVTSTKLICWLKLQVVPDKLLWNICTKLVNRKGGWYYVFWYYFKKNDDHPIIRLAKERYKK